MGYGILSITKNNLRLIIDDIIDLRTSYWVESRFYQELDGCKEITMSRSVCGLTKNLLHFWDPTRSWAYALNLYCQQLSSMYSF